jgi:hypothetical protein
LSEAVQLEPCGSGDRESFLLPSFKGYHVRHLPGLRYFRKDRSQ